MRFIAQKFLTDGERGRRTRLNFCHVGVAVLRGAGDDRRRRKICSAGKAKKAGECRGDGGDAQYSGQPQAAVSTIPKSIGSHCEFAADRFNVGGFGSGRSSDVDFRVAAFRG